MSSQKFRNNSFSRYESSTFFMPFCPYLCSKSLLRTEDSLLNKPLATELLVDVEDFDQYQVVGTPLVTFALKEFKVSARFSILPGSVFPDQLDKRPS